MKKKSNVKKTLNVVFNAIGWLFVAFAIGITVLVFAAQNDNGVPVIGGKCVINILTSSMEPTLISGDIIISDSLNPEEKQTLQAKDESKGIEGDIITFQIDLDGDGNLELNTHRIVGINYDASGKVESYVTQGDNKQTNLVPDTEPVKWQRVICKFSGTQIKGLGTFLSLLQTRVGFLLIIILPLLAIFIYELVKFLFTVKDVKGSKQPVSISAEEEELIKKKAIEEYLRQQAEANEQAEVNEKAEE